MVPWRTPLVLVAGALALFPSCAASAAPAQIIFLRHAEKPESGPELNERGWARAEALAELFAHDARVLEHGPAAAIFVMKPPGKNDSVRAIQTMEATAQALMIKVDRRFTRDEIDGLVRAILKTKRYDGKTVLICWEHKVIPAILTAFGWSNGPEKWRDDVYDRLWVLDLTQGKPTRFRDLPQKLLPGDSAK